VCVHPSLHLSLHLHLSTSLSLSLSLSLLDSILSLTLLIPPDRKIESDNLKGEMEEQNSSGKLWREKGER